MLQIRSLGSLESIVDTKYAQFKGTLSSWTNNGKKRAHGDTSIKSDTVVRASVLNSTRFAKQKFKMATIFQNGFQSEFTRWTFLTERVIFG